MSSYRTTSSTGGTGRDRGQKRTQSYEHDDSEDDADYIANSDVDAADSSDYEDRDDVARRPPGRGGGPGGPGHGPGHGPGGTGTGTSRKKPLAAGKKQKGVSSSGGRTSSGAQALDQQDSIFLDHVGSLSLKRDHAHRPIWISRDNTIYFEAFSPLYQQAYDFLVAIAEPKSRPQFIHSYQLTVNSLYAAVALGITTDSIIKMLHRLCKTDIPPEVVQYIRENTYTFGKAKLVLKDNKFYVESGNADVLHELLRNPNINNARLHDTEAVDEFVESAVLRDESHQLFSRLEIDDDNEVDDLLMGNGVTQLKTWSFMIDRRFVQEVKRAAKEESKYPLMEEYDFTKDHVNPKLEIFPKPSTNVRPYQAKALNKMFGNSRARSGIIVLPCGAGKSLTGISAAATVGRSTIVLCINNASVKQWKEEFTRWTTVSEKVIKLCTSQDKDALPDKKEACIVISTYSMLCHSGKRSESGLRMIGEIEGREWGLLILDEVHVAPADMFQKVLEKVNAHCKLGLTATLVREDDKIKDLHFLVGPKLYEANWKDLTEQGYLAKVQCVEVWCPMTKEFHEEYKKAYAVPDYRSSRIQRLLYALNPRKFRTCEYLVEEHVRRRDKVIIFSDDVPALLLYCKGLIVYKEDANGNKVPMKIPFVYGDTPEDERRRILHEFKTMPDCNCIGLSKVGDTALDIPEANVVVQISGQYGSRRQQAQRLGRILRPKPNPTGDFNAFFYTLVSQDTREMYFATKRQQYLVDQGYTFRVNQLIAENAERVAKTLSTKSKQLDLLAQILSFNYEQYDSKEDRSMSRHERGEVEDDDAAGSSAVGSSAPAAKRRVSALSKYTD